MKRLPTAEIISVGNELLIGHTLDTNSHWIAKRFTRFGWTLQRITVLRDSLAAIKDGVTGVLGRKPDLLITLGGLGPTHDDMTLKGIALALHKRLMIKVGTTWLVSLPGVPSEMKAIFTGSVIPMLRASKAEAPREVTVGLVGIIESALAPALDRTCKAFPGLYFKSHPRGREGGIRSLIQLHVYSVDPASRAKLDNAIAYLLRELSKSAYSGSKGQAKPGKKVL